MRRYACIDRSKPLTGLDYHIDNVFRKCVHFAPPVFGSAQLGIGELITFSVRKLSLSALLIKNISS